MGSRFASVLAAVVLVLSMLEAPSPAAAAQPRGGPTGDRLILVARSDADLDRLRDTVQRSGGTVLDDLSDLRDGGMLVVRANAATRSQVQASGLTSAIVPDHVEKLDPNPGPPHIGSRRGAPRPGNGGHNPTVTPDPAFHAPGLMWSIDRIHAPDAWSISTGEPSIRVGVADTGLDATHEDLAGRIAGAVDFTDKENPPLCETFFPTLIPGIDHPIGDSDLAPLFDVPVTNDFNGHGTWIGGNIAAALDREGVNGIAPNVKLVSLKVAQWCGFAYDSTMMAAFLYASKHNIDVVNISIGGYLDLSQPDQATLWRQFVTTVQQARNKGTLIVAAAGNEHVRLGPAGIVLSHGTLTVPGTSAADFDDEFGHFAVPGGVPGVISVAATSNVVVPSSDCRNVPPPSDPTLVTCKPRSDPHQAPAQGQEDQLAYYSNYGPRIDIAAPGGARKFNLPTWDRGGTFGFPYTTADGTTAFGAFSTTSNTGISVPPCYTTDGSGAQAVGAFPLPIAGFEPGQCYTTNQGTSLAAPHVVAAPALIASNERGARQDPDRLQRILLSSARKPGDNQTRALSPDDHSPGELLANACATGYCHLGGPRISNDEAYGAGLVDAKRALNRR